MTRVFIHIDRLVLKGFRHADRHAIADGLRAELSRQFSTPDAAIALTSRESTDVVRTAPVRVAPETKPFAVGTKAGRAVARGVKP